MKVVCSSKKVIISENAVQLQFLQGDELMTFRELFERWRDDPTFITFYVDTLKATDFSALYWEHPALRSTYLDLPYECIVQRSRPLERLSADEQSFERYIHQPELVVDFENLGGDARLVVPTKQTEEKIYSHLSKFIRLADAVQINAVFQRVGTTIFEEIEKKNTIWLNTAGLGVIWLHIWMDTRPKYYKTVAYKQADYLSDKFLS
ncbi:MAG: hypothetical protein AAGI23_03375 [Bacteroidota bacterium]